MARAAALLAALLRPALAALGTLIGLAVLILDLLIFAWRSLLGLLLLALLIRLTILLFIVRAIVLIAHAFTFSIAINHDGEGPFRFR